ncbi:hypothetical protein BH09DEP1_BH09DEP1_0020 [soil metagenome]
MNKPFLHISLFLIQFFLHMNIFSMVHNKESVIPDRHIETAKNLKQAIEDNDVAQVALLLRTQGAELIKYAINGYPYTHRCITNNRPAILNDLLAAGANPNEYDCRGWTPLHAAANEGKADAIEILLSHGADPDNLTLNIIRLTPLMLVTVSDIRVNLNPFETARLLLDAGADPSKTNSKGLTIAQLAKTCNNSERAMRLILFIQTYVAKRMIP